MSLKLNNLLYRLMEPSKYVMGNAYLEYLDFWYFSFSRWFFEYRLWCAKMIDSFNKYFSKQ